MTIDSLTLSEIYYLVNCHSFERASVNHPDRSKESKLRLQAACRRLVNAWLVEELRYRGIFILSKTGVRRVATLRLDYGLHVTPDGPKLNQRLLRVGERIDALTENGTWAELRYRGKDRFALFDDCMCSLCLDSPSTLDATLYQRPKASQAIEPISCPRVDSPTRSDRELVACFQAWRTARNRSGNPASSSYHEPTGGSYGRHMLPKWNHSFERYLADNKPALIEPIESRSRL